MIYSTAGIFAKIAANQSDLIKAIVFIGMEFFVLCIYALIWQQVLKRFQLAIAMSCKGITIIYAMGWSVILFRETITLWNIVGVILIIIGITVVTSDA